MTTAEKRTAKRELAGRSRRLTRVEARALTRRRLMDAAADVFADRGFRVASLVDVADRAGYTIGAVYSNFASKDELFQALMDERLRLTEEGLAAAFSGDVSDGTPKDVVEVQIERELDRMAAAEDAVPPRWWRLLSEFRVYAATAPAAQAELSAADLRCRKILASHVEHFTTDVGLVLPMSAMELAEVAMALIDGLRAAHAEGRSSLTSGEGLRRVIAAILSTSARIDPA